MVYCAFMKLLVDFIPVILFFIAYKSFDIYVATGVAIVVSFAQVVFYWIKHRSIERMHIITFFLILILGGLTLFLHDPTFIKWKPTGLYWAFALVFLGSAFIGKKTLFQKMMENNVELPSTVWRRLNHSWVVFFALMGVINLYVAYQFDTNTWVNFKLFGGLGITLLFVILQGVYLSRHMIEDNITGEASTKPKG